MSVRIAFPEDAGSIAAVESEAAGNPWSLDAVRTHLGLASTRAWLWADPDICGHLLTSRAADVAEVLTIGVLPNTRRRGIGRALLAAAEQTWRSDGVTEAFLEVRADNRVAQALYAATGWRQVAIRKDYYADNMDAAVLRLEVS